MNELVSTTMNVLSQKSDDHSVVASISHGAWRIAGSQSVCPKKQWTNLIGYLRHRNEAC
jgi:hypothetical protein